jgi:hypothetical protein
MHISRQFPDTPLRDVRATIVPARKNIFGNPKNFSRDVLHDRPREH